MSTRDLVLTAMFAGLIAVLGAFPALPISFIPVPVTLQTLGVMLAGALLGAWRGALATVLVIALVVIGFPILAGGRGGIAVLAGPTAGFLIGWVPGALVTGWVAARPGWSRGRPWRQFAGFLAGCVLGGIVTVYGVGVAWLAAITGVGLERAALGTIVFLPGDLLKAVLAAWIGVAMQRYDAIPRR